MKATTLLAALGALSFATADTTPPTPAPVPNTPAPNPPAPAPVPNPPAPYPPAPAPVPNAPAPKPPTPAPVPTTPKPAPVPKPKGSPTSPPATKQSPPPQSNRDEPREFDVGGWKFDFNGKSGWYAGWFRVPGFADEWVTCRGDAVTQHWINCDWTKDHKYSGIQTYLVNYPGENGGTRYWVKARYYDPKDDYFYIGAQEVVPGKKQDTAFTIWVDHHVKHHTQHKQLDDQ